MEKAAVEEYCDRLDLSQYFHIQNFGVLVVAEITTFTVVMVSENSYRKLGWRPEQLQACRLEELFPSRFQEFIRNIVHNGEQEVYYGHQTELSGARVRYAIPLTVHVKDNYVFVELEPDSSDDDYEDDIFNFSRYSNALTSLHNRHNSHDTILQAITEISAHESVMLYRYYEGGYGKVLAQQRAAHMPSFQDHYFPATDTPQPIKDLFKKRFYRYIPDVDYQQQQLKKDSSARHVDISTTQLRGVVPVHVGFMHNMGARSALSLPVVVDGSLWGIIACQSARAHHIPPSRRQLLKALADLFATVIWKQGLDYQSHIKSKAFELTNELSGQLTLTDPGDVDRVITHWLPRIADIIHFDGIIYCIRDLCYVQGQTLADSPAKKIYYQVGKHSQENIHEVELENFAEQLRGQDCNRIKNALLLVINRDLDSFILLCRVGVTHKAKWAGAKEAEVRQDQQQVAQVSPRSSFATFIETNYDTVVPFEEAEKVAAFQLQEFLSEKSHSKVLADKAFHDQLTGLPNRYYLEDVFKREKSIAKRNNFFYSLCIFDIDYFKDFNDTYGHQNGDIALRAVASAITGNYRYEDTVCRYGGEEFVVLMLGATAEVAYRRSTELLELIANTPVSLSCNRTVYLTVSAGVATIQPDYDDCSLETFIELADKYLYQAKQNGRNQVRAPNYCS